VSRIARRARNLGAMAPGPTGRVAAKAFLRPAERSEAQKEAALEMMEHRSI